MPASKYCETPTFSLSLPHPFHPIPHPCQLPRKVCCRTRFVSKYRQINRKLCAIPPPKLPRVEGWMGKNSFKPFLSGLNTCTDTQNAIVTLPRPYYHYKYYRCPYSILCITSLYKNESNRCEILIDMCFM